DSRGAALFDHQFTNSRKQSERHHIPISGLIKTWHIPYRVNTLLVYTSVEFCGGGGLNTKQAKDFLVEQTVEQAALEGVPLADVEKRMMYFTESDATSCENPIELND